MPEISDKTAAKIAAVTDPAKVDQGYVNAKVDQLRAGNPGAKVTRKPAPFRRDHINVKVPGQTKVRAIDLCPGDVVRAWDMDSFVCITQVYDVTTQIGDQRIEVHYREGAGIGEERSKLYARDAKFTVQDVNVTS